MIYRKYIKRVIDIVGAILLVFLFFWLFLLIAVLVKIRLGSPVIFQQKRIGINDKVFTLYKFRTMLDIRDSSNNLLSDEKRLTEFGRLLRALSIDELPEVWNVIRGEMSFIGPRPLVVEYLPFYTNQERRRHAVRPGITGLAQVSGRNEIDWETRFRLDLDYIDYLTPIQDIKILLLTFIKVLTRQSIRVGNQMELKDLNTLRREKNDS